jgi:NAD(P)H-hydrate epimerase
MYLLTADQIREADRRAIAAGIPALILMENAAHAVLHELEKSFPNLAQERIAIFCGKGNNGGDGLALARLLFLHHRPRVLHVILAETPGGLAEEQLRMLKALEIPVSDSLPQDLGATTLAIDALLGTGASGAPRGPVADLVHAFNQLSAARRWAVDVPTPGVVEVDATVAFAAPKLDAVLGGASGRLIVADIGIPQAFLNSQFHLTDPADFAPVLVPRPAASHKGSFGHVAILGGSPGKHGALQLAGLAALRAGAGLVTLSSPDPGFRPQLPDLMQATWGANFSAASVLAIGPGLGLEHRPLFADDPRPQVLDADALNQAAPWTRVVPPGLTRILTPHPKEMSRLLGRELGDPVTDARFFATEYQVILVLKSHRTLIAFPDGQLWVNPTGSPALAKGGSGDVLTGFIAALLAQFPNHVREAALAAVYLHGRCGELSAAASHERSSLASELPGFFSAALRAIQ